MNDNKYNDALDAEDQSKLSEDLGYAEDRNPTFRESLDNPMNDEPAMNDSPAMNDDPSNDEPMRDF